MPGTELRGARVPSARRVPMRRADAAAPATLSSGIGEFDVLLALILRAIPVPSANLQSPNNVTETLRVTAFERALLPFVVLFLASQQVVRSAAIPGFK